jgi:hypothetical protein
MKTTGKKVLDYTDVTYGLIRIKEGEIAKHLPTLYRPITIIDEQGVKYWKRMHLSVLNRIDGLTKLYRAHNVKIGDTVEMELDGNILKMSFKHNSENKASEVSTATEISFKEEEKEINELSEVLYSIKDKINRLEYLFYDNEMNVRAELVEPVLNQLGWSSPELAREQKGRNGKRVDIALYKGNTCMILVEVKAIDENLANEKLKMQLMSYLDDNRFTQVPYGILTNGQVWLLFHRDGTLLQGIDFMHSDGKDIIMFFSQFNYNCMRNDANIQRKGTENLYWAYPKRVVDFSIVETVDDEFTENVRIISEKNITQTFKRFIKEHLEDVIRLQDENRFSVTILSTKADELRNSSPVSYKDKTYYITGDYSTFLKRMIIKQIISELDLNADVNEIV